MRAKNDEAAGGGNPVGGLATGGEVCTSTRPQFTTRSPKCQINEAAYEATQAQIEIARRVVRHLLDGGSPDGTSPDDCGLYADTVAALLDAHAEGGTEAVRAAFNALARDDEGLIWLVAGAPADRQTRWTADELLTATFPEPRWAVPGIIPEGLSFLAGKSKVGKSWLCLQIAVAVATGGRVFGEKVERGRVLYLALEDNARRIQERLQKQNAPGGMDITFLTEWPRSLAAGGLADLQAEIAQGGYRLVVLDTFSRVAGGSDQMDVAEMTTVLAGLQRTAQIYTLAIVLVDHHRKNQGFLSDPVDDVLGSRAKSAVADCLLGLYREQGKHEATLSMTGRDIEMRELAMAWDGLTCCWQALGEAGQVRKDSLKSEVLTAVRELLALGELATNKSITAHLDGDKGSVSRALADLVREGYVVKGEKMGRVQAYALGDRGIL